MKLSKKQFTEACVAKWHAWREEGKAPKTRAAALVIIGRELAAIDRAVEIEKIRKQAFGFVTEEGVEELDCNLSYIAWDLTENNGRAMDYDRDANFFSGLLAQARNQIYTATRKMFVVPGTANQPVRVTLPTNVFVKGVGTRRVDQITPDQLRAIADGFIQEAKIQIARWKLMGAELRFVRQKMRELQAEAVALYADSKVVQITDGIKSSKAPLRKLAKREQRRLAAEQKKTA